MDRIERIEQALRDALQPESVELADQSRMHAGHEGAKGGGGHYDLVIVADRFARLGQVERHRLVYDALRDFMGTEIHALSIAAYAPDEL
jgi:BolA protein